MSLTCRVRVSLPSLPPGRASAILEALGPDNVDFPKGLGLDMSEADGGVILDFHGTNVKQLVSTIDEVLEHVQLALEATG